MRRLIVPVIALSIAAVPAAVEAQTPRTERGHFAPGMGARGAAINPAARVLEHREALGLSLDQVRQLQQIQARLEQQNQPLLDQIQAAAPGIGRGAALQARQRLQELTPEQRQEMRAQMEARRGTMQERRAEMQERRAQVTPEQREQMRAQMEARREQMRNATPEQRAALREEMRAQMEARRGEVQAGRGAGAALRQANPELQARLEAVRPAMQQLQENSRQARQDVQAVLSTQQQEQLRQLHQERAQEMRQRVQGMREHARPGAERPTNRMLRRGPAR